MTARWALLLLAACAPPASRRPGCHAWGTLPEQTSYVVSPTVQPDGLSVEAPDPAQVGAVVDAVERCLAPYIGARIPDGDAGWCPAFYPGVVRTCLTVAVRPSVPSCDGHTQLLPDLADPRSCLAKGVTPTAACPCRWRSGVQDQQTAITTPNLATLPDALVKIVTGCPYPWAVPALVPCMRSAPAAE